MGGGAQWWAECVVGEVGQSGGQEAVVDAGQEPGGVQAVVGDGVAVAVRDAGDEAAGFESAQVVGGLAGGDRPGLQSTQLGGERAQIAVGEPVGLTTERQQRL